LKQWPRPGHNGPASPGKPLFSTLTANVVYAPWTSGSCGQWEKATRQRCREFSWAAMTMSYSKGNYGLLKPRKKAPLPDKDWGGTCAKSPREGGYGQKSRGREGHRCVWGGKAHISANKKDVGGGPLKLVTFTISTKKGGPRRGKRYPAAVKTLLFKRL